MAGYDGPSIYHKKMDPERNSFLKKDDPIKEKRDTLFPDTQEKEKLAKQVLTRSHTRSSTPFQVTKVPSPIYGSQSRPEKKEEKVDYSLIKKRLEKEEATFLLFDGYVKEEYVNWLGETAEPNSFDSSHTRKKISASASYRIKKKNLKRRSGLSKSLSGIIEDERTSHDSRDKTMSSLFSSHLLEK